jgi:hypothetical protein
VITMTRQTTKPLDTLRLSPTNEPLLQLVDQWRRGSLDPNPPYQRDDVWTLDQRIALINSILTGTPLPAIITNRRQGMGSVRYVIDGKQRITTARMWFDGEFAAPASWFHPEDINETITLAPGGLLAEEYGDTGEYVYFPGLTPSGQGGFEVLASIPVSEGRLRTERAEAAVYLRVNGFGTPQTPADMANAVRVEQGEAK